MLKLVLVLKGWIVFVLVIIARPTEGNNNEHAVERKLVTSNPGFISIDCGVTDDYFDERTGIFYKSDTSFIDTGTNYEIPSNHYSPSPYFGRQVKNLRSFPQEIRNCYTLKPIQGKNNNYLIRAFFRYGNYDHKDQPPKFDLYIGANYWATMQTQTSATTYQEIIHVPSSDTIFVCLINMGDGIPFISALELRHLDNSSYRIEYGGLNLLYRYDMGVSSKIPVRYKDDVYDRLWSTPNYPYYVSINTTSDIDVQGSKDGYRPPPQVLRTAVVPLSGYNAYRFSFNLPGAEYYVYLHFAEIEKLVQSQKREFNIYLNDVEYHKGPITLDYLKPLSISIQNRSATGYISLYMNSTTGPELPPILNALEIFAPVPLQFSTEAEDVTTIMNIKQIYRINTDTWQGDPCLPSIFKWNNLTCSSHNTPRIISLNLSSSQLKGKIATSLSNLKAIQSLDLSYNELSGPIPELFAQLPNLKILNLTGNKLTGSVPQALIEKSKNKSLELSLEDNPKLCQTDSCNKQHKKILILIVATVAFVSIIFLGAFAIFWRIKKKRQGDVVTKSNIKSKNRTHSYYEVKSITNNFKTIIGEGGFGKVYYGTLKNGTQVAVKLLSPSSKQGNKEFEAEAKLLMIVHHRNLVSLVGYCDHGANKALIYEYMANGNLHQHLSGANTNVLNWNERLKIAVDAAHGLEYLHNGCTPPIIHRDLKPSNILLNERMQAKIADFGLSRAFATDVSHVSTRPAGTPGYLDPEFHSSGNLNKKSDVYSFGIILFELITGRPAIMRGPGTNIHILEWVHPIIDNGDIQNIIDPRLRGDFNTNSAWKALEIAMSCTPPVAIQRPDMSNVLAELKECLALVEMAQMAMVTDANKTTSSNNSFKMTPSEVESAIFPYAR